MRSLYSIACKFLEHARTTGGGGAAAARRLDVFFRVIDVLISQCSNSFFRCMYVCMYVRRAARAVERGAPGCDYFVVLRKKYPSMLGI